MSLSEEDRNTMKQHYLAKADAMLLRADEFYAQQDYSLAAKRFYYACFHAIHALFMMDGIYAKSHEGMNVLFSQHYVKTEKVERKVGPFITKLESLREKADYNVIFEVTAEDLETMQPLSHELITLIHQLLDTQI